MVSINNNFVNKTFANVSSPVAFKGRKQDDTPKVSLTQQPDTVSFSGKIKEKSSPKTSEQVFSEIERYSEQLYLDPPLSKNGCLEICNIPTSDAMNGIAKIILSAEKNGTKIDAKDLKTLLEKLTEKPLRIRKSTASKMILGSDYQALIHDKQLKSAFKSVCNMMERTPQKDDESTGAYLKRLNTLNVKRNKQLEKGRISIIKSRLKYEPENEVKKEKLIELTDSERLELIELINGEIEYSDLSIDFLKEDASMQEIVDAWQYTYLCDLAIPKDNKVLEKGCLAVLQRLGRYNSENPPHTKDLCAVEVVEKDYKSEFKSEPVYRWLHISTPNTFIKNLPKNGEIYSYPQFQSCSTHKTYAETSYNDEMDSLNVKFVIHPKSKTSKAYTLGVGQEVIYPPNVKFRILDKSLVEDVIKPANKSEKPFSIYRWEVHMQEV